MKNILKSTKGKTNIRLLSPMILYRPERACSDLGTVKFIMTVDSGKEQRRQGEDSVLLGVALHRERKFQI